uniref:MADF domain-containing protein n=1 Tax=Bactrocera latifrons TaxID=174628 RepID=A0A0K8UZM1_BACLA
MDWRQAEIFDLISMYRESECLWNYLNPEYKDVDLKKNAWREIAAFFGRKVEDVKKKLKHLRTSYLLEKKKVERKRTEAGESRYEPRLFYYDEMTFLDSVVILRILKPTEQNGDSLSEIKQNSSTNDGHMITEKKKRKLFSNSQTERSHSEFSPIKRLRDISDVHLDNELQDELEEEKLLSKEDTFCAMLCSELKSLKSKDIYDNVTFEIFTILRNAKMAERQEIYQPEEITKVASIKM